MTEIKIYEMQKLNVNEKRWQSEGMSHWKTGVDEEKKIEDATKSSDGRSAGALFFSFFFFLPIFGPPIKLANQVELNILTAT